MDLKINKYLFFILSLHKLLKNQSTDRRRHRFAHKFQSIAATAASKTWGGQPHIPLTPSAFAACGATHFCGCRRQQNNIPLTAAAAKVGSPACSERRRRERNVGLLFLKKKAAAAATDCCSNGVKKITHCFALIFLLLLSLMFFSCQKKKVAKPVTPRVKTALIQKETVPIYVDAIGKVISPVTVNIRPQVAGKLINVFVQQGALVNEGEVIYEIDPRPYQAILDEATAQLAHDQALLVYAEKTVERYKKVVEEDFVSVLTYEQYESNAAAAKAQVEQDKAAIRAAQINLDFCKIVAPVSGKISYYNVDVGNILAVDDPNQITVIRPFSPIDITFSLPQQQFEMIRKEQGDAGIWKFIATLPERPTFPFEGISYFIDNQVDQNTGTILLKGRLNNIQRDLWPGEFIKVKVLYKMAKDALIVPPSSVLIGKDGPYIYILDENHKAIAQNVTVLTRTDTYTAIQSDVLHEGKTVVIDGQINLAPGIKVSEVSNTTP